MNVIQFPQIISIYEFSEGKTPKPLCENYVIENWNRNRNPKDPEVKL